MNVSDLQDWHSYNERELLPLTELERLALEESRQRVGYSRKRSLLSLGMSEKDVAVNETELEEERSATVDQFARTFNGG